MRRLILISLLLLLSACGGVTTRPPPAGALVGDARLRPVEDDKTLLMRLYRQHQVWRGTPYRLGGQSRSGIDCSGFVQLTYRSQLGRSLPRTTSQQAGFGIPVNRAELMTGDLIFFKINGITQHVGIYLEQNRFLHASKSSGVMISALDSPYWQSAYWQSRRVL
ncbi:NlpC/P60 family protein [Sedimenticola sp.]|uniref:NlpC/P60 family protein n=1 Tax=Sedimenticola sp. TaxID=1940285 RepID=UPI003D117FE8